METSAREIPQAQGEGSVKTGKMLLEDWGDVAGICHT